MPFYESVLIARQELTPAKVSDLVEKFVSVIEKDGGKVTKKENWGLRTLTYKIKKNKKGYYTLLNIDAPAKAVIEMERLMRFDEDILRYLTTRVDVLDESPSIIMETKNRRSKYEDNDSSEENVIEKETL